LSDDDSYVTDRLDDPEQFQQKLIGIHNEAADSDASTEDVAEILLERLDDDELVCMLHGAVKEETLDMYIRDLGEAVEKVDHAYEVDTGV